MQTNKTARTAANQQSNARINALSMDFLQQERLQEEIEIQALRDRFARTDDDRFSLAVQADL